MDQSYAVSVRLPTIWATKKPVQSGCLQNLMKRPDRTRLLNTNPQWVVFSLCLACYSHLPLVQLRCCLSAVRSLLQGRAKMHAQGQGMQQGMYFMPSAQGEVWPIWADIGREVVGLIAGRTHVFKASPQEYGHQVGWRRGPRGGESGRWRREARKFKID